MVGKEEWRLLTKINKTWKEANAAEAAAARFLYLGATSDVVDSEEFIQADEALEFYITEIGRDLSLLAQRLNVPVFVAEIEQTRTRCAKEGTRLAPITDDVGVYSASLRDLWMLYRSIETMVSAKAPTGLDIFANILKSTPQLFLSRQEADPSNEKDVERELLRIVKYAFLDAQRGIPIQQMFKSYEPDVCVPSLAAAAELKFVANRSGLGPALDGIYADMRGYAGHSEWQTFYAVIYMTEPFMTQDQLDHAFAEVKADDTWIPIAVVGPGARGSKKTDAS